MKSAILSKSLSNNHCRRALQALGFACLAATALSHARAQTVYTWDGGTGNWSDNTMWNPTVSPNTADADVYIDNGKTGVNSVVTMDNSYTVGRLTLDAGDTLNLANNVTFTLASSFNGSESIINNGTINFNSTGNGIDLRYTGANASLTGTGTMNLTGANNRVFANNGSGDRLTIGTGATIAGTGNLGVGQSTFTNNGLVNANISGATLVLQPGGGNGSDFSNGTGGIAQASNGGVLQLFGGGTFTGGTFRALAGSAVNVGGGANVVSTTLTTVGTGTVTITDSANLNNVTLAGTINAANNSTTTLFGTLTNNGTFTLASSGNGDDLRFTGANEVLAGTGTLVLSGANDRVYATNGSGDRLTIAAQAYIDGRGNLGIGQSTFTNNGTVNANVNGQTLTLQPGSGNGSDFTNNNVAEATNGGTLALFGGGTFTGSGMFQALDGSAITIGSGTNVFSTTLSTSGSGTIVLTDTATLNNVTNNGALIAANNTTTYLTGTLTNNATFNLNSSGNGDDLRFVGSSEALAGTGTLNLNGANDRVFANGGSGDRLTIAAGATIAGTGNLGVGQSTFTNNGVVNANQSGLSLVLQPGGGQDSTFTTGVTGVTEATNGGVMVQNSGSFTNNGVYAVISGNTGGSSLSVDAGRLTNFSGTTLTGGTYNVISSNTANTSTLSFGGGTITINAANVTLSGASTVFSEINGLNNNQGSFTVANGRNFMTAGALANSGTLIAAGGSTLAVGGALTQASAGILAGNGTLSASTFTLSGRVAPGGSVSATSGAFTGGAGTLTLGGTVFLNSDANLTFELGAVSGGPNDHLNVTGALTLDGRLDVTALTGFGAGRYDLIDYTGALTNNVLALGTLPAGYTYAIDTSLTGQVDLLVTAAVPEPATWLGGLGLLGAAGLTLRRSRVC